MMSRLLSGDFTDYNGLSRRQSAMLGAALFLPVCLLAIATRFYHALWITGALLLVVAACDLIIIAWIRKHLKSYAEKIVKNRVLTRRAQRISKYYESVLQDSTDIIFTLGKDWYILKFNRGGQILFGYSQEEILGKPFGQLFVNDSDRQKVHDGVKETGKTINEDIPMKAKDGRIILVNLSVSKMKNEANEDIGLVGTAKDITEKKRLEMELIKKSELLGKLAVTDGLTGIYNSRHFRDQIKREMSRLKRNPDRKLTLVMLDIDFFKQLNDSEGHQMGDHTLKALANVIKVCIRKDIDTAYRYGGDEFVIILPDTEKHQAHVVTDRIAKQFGAFKFGKTSLSMGIAEALPNEEDQQLLRRADEALYTSKREGRARITVAP
ncbi:MAG: sensor domain-containing diguanylate cyclase [Chitinispirillaceae bacterium]|jgi:diguanylate cyclase (GGDEF)-like protein/PAS domain S-box-containing protein|nr:sensor domain-containing diguanylate cyclase [Chitinispirillaceae bacterium]